MKRIINARLVLEHDIVASDLLIDGDRIVGLADQPVKPGEQVIDACNGYVLPGLIDIHSDYIERMVNPRPSAMMDLNLSLHELERSLLSSGITTMYHSLSLYSEEIFGQKIIRQPDNVRRLMNHLYQMRDQDHLIRHRFHCRLEIDNLDQVEFIEQSIDQGKIHLLSFMDHTPGQGQYRDLEVYRKTINGYTDASDSVIDDQILRSQAKPKLTMERLAELSDYSKRAGVVVASHDDDTLDKLGLVAAMGIEISEFPITLEVAQAACDQGLYVVLGAPNVLLGGSHSGNVSARQAIEQGACHILCSDYYPAALLHAVFQLQKDQILSLPEAVQLVSLGPAKALAIEADYGSIAPGKKADLVIVHPDDSHQPHISSVLVDGRPRLQVHHRWQSC